MISRFLDQMILVPTREPISSPALKCRAVKRDGIEFEIWSQNFDRYEQRRINVLKFSGSAGRAENATVDPLPIWKRGGHVWSVNPPGFGGSPGAASVSNCVTAARAAVELMLEEHSDTPLLVMGVSLGAALALHVAANYPVCAIAMRDVPDIRQVIRARYRYLLFSGAVADWGIPDSISSAKNARKCTAPAIFVSSRKDKLVPPACQDAVIKAYAAEHRVLMLPESEHAMPIEAGQLRAYVELQRWLSERVGV